MADRQRTWALLWGAVVAALAVLVLLRMASGGAISTDLKALLPGQARDTAVEAAVSRTQDQLERRLFITVGGVVTPEQAAAAAGKVRQVLLRSGHLRAVAFAHQDATEAMGALYFRNRFGLVSSDMRRLLADGENDAALERAVLRQYFNPAAGASSAVAGHDPLLLFPGFLTERQAALGAHRFEIVGGEAVARTENEAHAVLQLELTGSPYALTVQEAVTKAIAEARAQASADNAAMVVRVAGVLPYAAAGTASAQSEVSTLGLVSLAGVAFLLIVPFRSGRPLLYGATVIGVGTVVGLAACLLAFGSVHMLTLVFAVSLIGTSIDFVFHVLASRLRPAEYWDANASLRHARPGLTMALITTLIGYAGLIASGFPGLLQIAVFSMAGLTGAFATALLWFSLFIKSGPTLSLGMPGRAAQAWLSATERPTYRSTLVIAVAAVCMLGLVGLWRIEGQDDIRQFQSLDPAIAAEEQAVKTLLGNDITGQFLLVTGRDAAEVLAREEAAQQTLDRLAADGTVQGYVALSQFVPSPDRQREVIRQLRNGAASDGGVVDRIAQQIGLRRELVEQYRKELAAAQPLMLNDWLASPASAPYRMLWVGQLDRDAADDASRFASIIPLRGVADPAKLLAVAYPDGVTFVDPAHDISTLFATYRERAILLIIASYAAVALLLAGSYGVHEGLRVMVPPVAAALGVVAVLTVLGHSFTLFHTMALLLVLGMGVDYGIFFRESEAGDWTTLIAVALCAMTTLLAFGLLALSQTAAVAAFGQTVAIGITLAFVVAPLAKRQPHGKRTSLEITNAY